jgi:hypothetical protein
MKRETRATNQNRGTPFPSAGNSHPVERLRMFVFFLVFKVENHILMGSGDEIRGQPEHLEVVWEFC